MISDINDNNSGGVNKRTSDKYRFGLVGNVVDRINEVNQRQAQLVLAWVTVGKTSRYVTSNPGQLSLAIPPFVAKRNKYQRQLGHKQTHRAMH